MDSIASAAARRLPSTGASSCDSSPESASAAAFFALISASLRASSACISSSVGPFSVTIPVCNS